jgi:hypothetical protein
MVRPHRDAYFHTQFREEQKLGVKNQPIRYTEKPPKASTLKRISSLFLLKPNKVIHWILPNVDYAAELASALQQLFKATDLVSQVQIVQPNGYNSEYDVVYPSIYARILVRFLTAVQSVNIPENTTLELLDIPVTHLEEAGLELSAPVASRALSKFSSLTLRSRYMAYEVVPQGSVKRARSLFRLDPGLNMNGLGYQLLTAIGTSNSNFKSLKIFDDARTSLIDHIVSTTQWPNLRRLAFENFRVTAESFEPFMVACLPQLEALSLRNGTLLYKGPHPAAWKDHFDAWVTLKEGLPTDQWSLKLLIAVNLYSTHASAPPLTGKEITTYAHKLVRAQYVNLKHNSVLLILHPKT